MQIEAYLNGIFPRSDYALDFGSSWLKGRETKERFYKVLEKETEELIQLQENHLYQKLAHKQYYFLSYLKVF